MSDREEFPVAGVTSASMVSSWSWEFKAELSLELGVVSPTPSPSFPYGALLVFLSTSCFTAMPSPAIGWCLLGWAALSPVALLGQDELPLHLQGQLLSYSPYLEAFLEQSRGQGPWLVCSHFQCYEIRTGWRGHASGDCFLTSVLHLFSSRWCFLWKG